MAEPGPSGPAASTAAGDFPELLGFCARAEALIAELLLLSDRAPPQFADRRFDPVLFDFRYFDSPSDFELRIDGNVEVEALEDQLRESCGPYMLRFFSLLDGAVTYHEELCSYLNELKEGLYVHCTLDSVLDNNSACQLLVESMALFGCMILLMEHKIGGLLRERLLVGHLRYQHCFDHPDLERICELCRQHVPTPGSSASSGSSPFLSEVISVQRPEDLLGRFPFPEPVVDAVITCLRNGDVYNNIRFYPDPQHRTTALSLQGGRLYVLLFYSRDLLHNGLVMREIVDRFFKDNWVVPIFLHFSADLLVSWDVYKEAKISLVSCFSPASIRDISLHHYTKVPHLLVDLDIHIRALNKKYVLDNSPSLLSIIRECNFTLRWVLLHRLTSDKKARDLVVSVGLSHQVNEGSLLQLLLRTSKLESEVKQLHVELLRTRESMWNEKRDDALECIKDLSQNYFGVWAASCKFKNKTLKDWLEQLLSEVISLNYTAIGSSGRTIHRVLSTLKDIEMLHQIKESVQIKEGFSKIQKDLHDMIKVLNLNQDATSIFSVITDAKYTWVYLTLFETHLKKNVSQNPSEILLLNAMFLKFQSWLSAPLQRIKQCESPDLHCVSTYYSSKYAAKIFAVLDVIPVLLLKKSTAVDYVNAEQSTHLVNRINKETLEELMQMDQQLCEARQAAKLCIISEGLRNMAKNFDDLINLDLGGWLKRMILRELAVQLEGKLKCLSSPTCGDIDSNLNSLSNYMLSQMQRVEFLQDILHIGGSSIWQETLTTVLEQCAKKELLELMACTERSANVVKQLNKVSSPSTIFGNLLQHIVQLTNPSHSMFIEAMVGWSRKSPNPPPTLTRARSPGETGPSQSALVQPLRRKQRSTCARPSWAELPRALDMGEAREFFWCKSRAERGSNPEPAAPQREALPLSYQLRCLFLLVSLLDKQNACGVQDSVTVGRVAEKADIVLPVATVSGTHARLEKKDGMLLVTDLDSTNGTYINERRLVPGFPIAIEPGSLLIFGDTHLAMFRVSKMIVQVPSEADQESKTEAVSAAVEETTS